MLFEFKNIIILSIIFAFNVVSFVPAQVQAMERRQPVINRDQVEDVELKQLLKVILWLATITSLYFSCTDKNGDYLLESFSNYIFGTKN